MSYRHFGVPMQLWREAMPEGMFLKSQGFASNLSDPEGTHTLEAFCQATGRPYTSYGLPGIAGHVRHLRPVVPRPNSYLKVEEVLVTDVVRRADGFELTPGQRRAVRARKVVVAIGVEHFAYVPRAAVRRCPPRCARTARRTPTWRRSAARRSSSSAPASQRSSRRRCCTRTAPLFRSLARRTAIALERPAAGPQTGRCCSGSGSPRPGSARAGPPGSTPTTRSCSGACRGTPGCTGRAPRSGRPGPAGCASGSRASSRSGPASRSSRPRCWTSRSSWGWPSPGRPARELAADHVIAATGYRSDLTRLAFLPRQRCGPRCGPWAGSAAVGTRLPVLRSPACTSSGPAVAPTMGPVMRFVFGSEHAATTVAGAHRRPAQAGESCTGGGCRPVMTSDYEQLRRRRGHGPGSAAGRCSAAPGAPPAARAESAPGRRRRQAGQPASGGGAAGRGHGRARGRVRRQRAERRRRGHALPRGSTSPSC